MKQLFVGRASESELVKLWDYLLVQDDPVCSAVFVAVAVLQEYRESLLAVEDGNNLHTAVQSFVFTDAVQCCKRAKLLESNTPSSFRTLISSISSSDVTADSHNDSIHALLKTTVCLSVPVTEVLKFQINQVLSLAPCILITDTHAQDNSTQQEEDSDEGVKFLVVDCRAAEHVKNGRLPNSLHLDPTMVSMLFYC